MSIKRAVAAILAPALVSAWMSAAAEPGAGQRLNFVACPIVRNTYVPCWLAEHEGELYFLGVQGDLGTEFYPPQLRHKALVEGVVSDEPRACGGIVLKPVKVSVLPELTEACNSIIPADGYLNPPAHRTPGPSNSEREEGNRRRGAQAFEPPYESRTFSVPFEFDVGDRLYARDSRIVAMAARYAEAAGAKSVEVIGYRGGALLSDDTRLREGEDIPERRARMIGEMLAHAGVAADSIRQKTADAEEADGVDDYLLRRVDIVVNP